MLARCLSLPSTNELANFLGLLACKSRAVTMVNHFCLDEATRDITMQFRTISRALHSRWVNLGHSIETILLKKQNGLFVP